MGYFSTGQSPTWNRNVVQCYNQSLEQRNRHVAEYYSQCLVPFPRTSEAITMIFFKLDYQIPVVPLLIIDVLYSVMHILRDIFYDALFFFIPII